MAEKEVNRQHTLTSIQKVALLLIAFGADRASPILKELGEQEVERISIEIARIP